MLPEKGIWQALSPGRLAHFSAFIDDYQAIRAAEGRGSSEAEYYLHLPFEDLTGKNSWQWNIRARTYDSLTSKLLSPLLDSLTRRPVVLDLGAGCGWMSYRLAVQGYLPVAADLLINEADGLGAAWHFAKHLGCLFPRFRAEMARLPFVDAQFDAVIFNASFHYAEDYEAVTREALRCVRPGGLVIIADTPWYSSDDSGRKMLEERRSAFVKRYGTASDSMNSLEYLTDLRLRHLERALRIRWERITPGYGLRWAMRPLLAKLRGRREPSHFHLYSARKRS
jgi:SAM-dependent methyltransferase